MNIDEILKKYGGTTAPPTGGSNNIDEIAKKYGGVSGQQKSFRFDVVESREEKVARLQREAQEADREAKKQTSVKGFAKNVVAAPAMENLPFVGGAISVAKTLNKVIDSPANRGDVSKTYADAATTILKTILERENKGQDTTKLKKIYNEVADELDNITAEIESANKELPTDRQAVGQVLRTGVDALSGGTFSNKFQTGVLGRGRPTILPEGKAGLFSTQTVKDVAQAVPFGYGFDVAQGLEGKRGEYANPFMPGAGTTLGLVAPPVLRGAQGLENTIRTGLSLSTRSGAQNVLRTEVNDLLTGNKSFAGKLRLAEQKNVPLIDMISEPEVYQGIRVQKGTIVPDEAVSTLQKRLDLYMDAKGKILPEIERLMPQKISKAQILERAKKDFQVTGAPPADQNKIIARIERQLDALPDEIGLVELDKLRAKFRRGARDAKDLQKSYNEYSALENATRDTVFDVTDNLPFDTNKEFQALNTEIKNTLATMEFIDQSLRGSKVKGGRMGQYFSRVVGSIAGSKLGPIGSLVGSEIGAAVNRILQNNQYGTSFKMKLIRNMTDDPKVLREAERFLNQLQNTKPLALPPGSSDIQTTIESGSTMNIPTRGAVPLGIGNEPQRGLPPS